MPSKHTSSSKRSRALGGQLRHSKETYNKDQHDDIDGARRSPLRDQPEWLKEFTEIFNE